MKSKTLTGHVSILKYWSAYDKEDKVGNLNRPPQVDLVHARYVLFVNVPAKMRENSDNLDIWQTHS